MDLNAYDHMVFLLALCAFQEIKQWKNLLILITAFTIGHSFTLILAALKVIVFPVEIIEFLIPCTIFATSISAFFKSKYVLRTNILFLLIVVFGLIHGIGFSNYLLQLLGNAPSIILPLFSFNVGIELGQIFVVVIILLLKTIIETIPNLNVQKFRFWISGLTAGISIILMMESSFW
ncbi:HupE/UreJ family protein [Hyphobacterium sp. CCMP332]|nr:HupE/UreJ family protein [Hyphobacterium sp. CCMP332]